MTTRSRFTFCMFVVSVCIDFFLFTRSNNPHQLTDQQHSIDADSTRIYVELFSTFEILQVSFLTMIEYYALPWKFAIIWVKWRVRPRPCMTFKHIIVVANTNIFVRNIGVKKITMGWFKMLSTITLIGVFKFNTLLVNFNIVSNTNFKILLMRQLPNLKIATSSIRFFVAFHFCGF